LLKKLTPAEAVSLLIERFPMVLDLGESREELIDTGPFYAFERFASEALKRKSDKNFLQLVGFFVDELAESKDPLLQELLVVSVLEKLAEDPNAAVKLIPHMGEKARGSAGLCPRNHHCVFPTQGCGLKHECLYLSGTQPQSGDRA
jgi:hypothetical protein